MTFNTASNYTLENERVWLRPLVLEDVDHLFCYALKEPELWKYASVSGAGEDGMRHYVKLALEAKSRGVEYPFIVYDKHLNTYAGSTRFYDIQPINQTLQLGYTWYGKQFQGTGLNKNCKLLLLELAFDALGFERVEFRADNSNQKSIAAMKSIGCTVEGVLRSNMPKLTGGRRDSIVLSILKQEWNAGLKEALQVRCNN